MKLRYLPINKENLRKQPDYFTIEITDNILAFVVRWNEVGRFFSFDIYDEDGGPILLGRKIVYASDMLSQVDIDAEILPVSKQEDAEAERTGITFDNFMRDVKPYIFTDSDD